jgi:hypothetical protein
MRIFAFDEDNQKITVDEFFARHRAFSNCQLKQQTARKLKTLMRHIKHPEVLAEAVSDGYELKLSDESNTYHLLFDIEQDTILLKELK